MSVQITRSVVCIIISILLLIPTGPHLSAEQAERNLHAKCQEAWHIASGEYRRLVEDVGLDKNYLEQPRWYDNGYSMIGRMPLIDSALEAPEMLPNFALSLDHHVQKHRRYMYELLAVTQYMADGADTIGLHNRRYSINLHSMTDDYLDDLSNLPEEINGLIRSINENNRVSEPLQNLCGIIIKGAATASALRDDAFSGLSSDEIERIESLLPQYFLPLDENGSRQFRAYTVNTLDDCIDLIFLLAKIDWEMMREASREIGRITDMVHVILDSYDRNEPGCSETGIIIDTETSIGRIIIGGIRDNIYTEDCAVLIDFGGDDVYLNNAGSTSPTGYGAAVLFDLSGNDTYQGSDFVQGAGFGGVGALIDVSGNDNYSARHYSQGTALGGYSIFHEGGGDDTYSADLGGQCCAIFGASVFREAGGNDTYRVQSMGQGFASTYGVALMCEQDGHDTYRAGGKYGFYNPVDSACAQGAAMGMRVWPPTDKLTVYGGIALLSEAAGNDNYIGYSFVQGASYIFSLGMIVDSGGDDFYSGESYVQGSGCHLSAGVLVDKTGNDIYKVSNVGGGFSLDRSAGVLFDYEGNDIYYGGHEACGAAVKPWGVGIFVDASGNDTYNRAHFGYARYPYAEHAHSVGVFFDFGGDDFYQRNARENNSTWQKGFYGFGEDLDEPPSNQPGFMHIYFRESLHIEETHNLASANILQRLHGIGDLIASDDPFPTIHHLAGVYGRHNEREIHDTIEILRLRGRISPDDRLVIAELLKSRKPDLRLAAAIFFFRSPSVDAGEIQLLIDAVSSETDYRVSSMLARCLGKTGNPDVIPALINLLQTGIHWEIRRASAVALGSFEGNEDAIMALESSLQHEESYRVRTQAAKSLAEIAGIYSRDKLIAALTDESGFVGIQAAMGLLEYAKDTGGIPAIIEMMDEVEIKYIIITYAVPLLRDITGSNISGKENWSTWWSENETTFDLAEGLKLRAQISEARKLNTDGDIIEAENILRRVLESNPEHYQAKILLAEILNKHAWDIAVSGDNLQYGVELAQECVLLDNNPNYIDTLSVLLYKNGDKQAAMDVINRTIESRDDLTKAQLETLTFRLDQFYRGEVSLN